MPVLQYSLHTFTGQHRTVDNTLTTDGRFATRFPPPLGMCSSSGCTATVRFRHVVAGRIHSGGVQRGGVPASEDGATRESRDGDRSDVPRPQPRRGDLLQRPAQRPAGRLHLTDAEGRIRGIQVRCCTRFYLRFCTIILIMHNAIFTLVYFILLYYLSLIQCVVYLFFFFDLLVNFL